MRTVIESPFAGATPEEIDRNTRYLRRAMRHALLIGDAPFASHGLYTLPGVLRDELPAERRLGMTAGFVWGELADLVVVYDDHGVSPGMERGIELAISRGQRIEHRRIGKEPL